ncbi:MAG: UDP-N-acetylmuramoyl-L-alanyl-D-glutamate--2,6-diaminopimelate ligase [Gammaproteobacteria bacterium]|nr:UDP-N-acetylmuramoyl-L-alanyl-D-glutamate--2,6-diaminopimelate ligase [Gammaproteobacteria bacterium]
MTKKTASVNEISRNLSIIGVTGTNGKTSITHFIAQLLAVAGIRCGLIGTLGFGELGALVPSGYTTPDLLANQRILEDFKQKSIKVVAMEVSSHALDQHRVKGIHFHTGIFSNLTHDHLDYHKTFDHYWTTKKKLWTEGQPAFCVANAEDPYGLDLLDSSIRAKKIAYTTQSIAALKGVDNITVQDLIFDPQGIRAWIKTPWGEGLLASSLWGRFNLSNLLAAIAGACLEGMAFQSVLEAIPALHTVLGRMMRIGGINQQPLVVVDYAHTPDALVQVLRAVRLHMNRMGQLWVVIGCGGDRDKAKRPLMAGLAEAQADRLILTQDNPRTEDPKAIMHDMIQGLKNPEKVMIEYDRRKAIEQVIVQAKPEDLILVAGKGHESMQIIGSTSFPFSDSEVVQQCLEILA